jgi:hypothetical protein
MKKILKYINSMPFRFTMKHYQIFGESTAQMKDQGLMSPESWDVLRETHPFFSIPENREEWVAVSELKVKKDGQDNMLIERARDVVSLLQREKVDRVFSIGVGGAGLEYQLKKMLPDLKVVCSDYSEVTVVRLKKVFTESEEVIRFDIHNDSLTEAQKKYIGEKGICIMYRIDASFSDEEWTQIFKRFSEAGIQKVLYIPTGMLTILSTYNRLSRQIKWFFQKTPVVLCGHVRTKKSFEGFWSEYYQQEDLVFGGLKGFLLTRKIT